MKEITVRAHAKLNISLDVLDARADGYHEMKMVMQSIEMGDDVTIRVNESGKFRALSNLGFLPSDERNIAVKAAKLFYSRAGMENMGADISLKKVTPVCAGMGGGSADGAAVLRALNELFDRPFTPAQLEEMSHSVGSDVAFCVRGGTSLATGRGEILTPLPDFPECSIVICKPSFSISTPELFKQIDSRKKRIHPDTDGIVTSLEKSDLRGITMRMYNVFEEVLPRRFGEIAEIKGALTDLGAIGAMMTGTGSAVFGIFDSAEKAAAAHAQLAGRYRECYLTRPINRYY